MLYQMTSLHGCRRGHYGHFCIRSFVSFAYSPKYHQNSSKQHIVLSTVHNFNCRGLNFSLYISLFDVSQIICKFGSFAYSRWLPKQPTYALNRIFSCLQPTLTQVFICFWYFRKFVSFIYAAFILLPFNSCICFSAFRTEY